MKNKSNILLYILLLIIIALLAGILFKDQIRWYFEKREIASRANIFNVPEIYVNCYDDLKSDSDELSDKCRGKLAEFRDKQKYWDALINQKKDISCKDFNTGWDAFEFNSYIGGEFVQHINVAESSDKAYMTGNDLKCSYDPYNLDTNGDCKPCENLGGGE